MVAGHVAMADVSMVSSCTGRDISNTRVSSNHEGIDRLIVLVVS